MPFARHPVSSALELYHTNLSTCSQKVRLCLEEKGLLWQSHHIDLLRDEHISPDYLRINPKGLVPALVHHGAVITESTQINEYLELNFPSPRLLPSNAAQRAKIEGWIQKQDDIQAAIKVLSFELLFKPVFRKSDQQLDHFASHHPDPELVDFHRWISQKKGLPQDKLEHALQTLNAVLQELEAQLSQTHWIANSEFSLADITWTPVVHRLALIGYQWETLPHLEAWYGRIQQRPSFTTMVSAFEPWYVRTFFRLYRRFRRQPDLVRKFIEGKVIRPPSPR